MKPQVTKVKSIRSWPWPATKCQVRTFLGFVEYYQQLIEEPAKPCSVDSRDRDSLPKSEGRYVYRTHPSHPGLQEAQIQDNIEHPLMYISRKLLKRKQNYATIEKEGLAIKWVLGKLQYYLLGRAFVLVTEHAPLKWMVTNKGNNAMITCWNCKILGSAWSISWGSRTAMQIPCPDRKRWSGRSLRPSARTWGGGYVTPHMVKNTKAPQEAASPRKDR